MSKIDITDNKKYPTVGEMLEYIYNNDIPMDAIVTCEQLSDYYLENKDDSKNWDYYEVQVGNYIDENSIECPILNKLIPIHNRFGSARYKKLFVLWMHY
jgi:hypothetical protein